MDMAGKYFEPEYIKHGNQLVIKRQIEIWVKNLICGFITKEIEMTNEDENVLNLVRNQVNVIKTTVRYHEPSSRFEEIIKS